MAGYEMMSQRSKKKKRTKKTHKRPGVVAGVDLGIPTHAAGSPGGPGFASAPAHLRRT